MDSFSDYPVADGASVEAECSAVIGSDERRMHVRAYNYWCSLLEGRDYPSIEDLEPGDIEDFGPHSVLLDFTEGRENPATQYIGSAIREECGLDDSVRSIADVPSRSLLSRLTDHYMQIIANRAPVGFEAEFVNQRGRAICYRGILMPFSSDGDTIDFIYGVINWKNLGEAAGQSQVVQAVLPPIDAADGEAGLAEDEPLELVVPFAGDDEELVEGAEEATGAPHLRWEDGPLADAGSETETADEAEADLQLDPDAGLADRLWAARETAEVCKQADGRSRAALYRALAMAYDFAVATRRVPDEYAEILEDAGVKAQARAPMTPIVKLVFGIDYDKTRLTEFAAALSYAERQDIDFGGFLEFVEQADGGLKGLVAAERKARRPDRAASDKVEVGKKALRSASPIPLTQLPTNQEFALVLTRRNANGVHEIVELVADSSMLERALRRAAG